MTRLVVDSSVVIKWSVPEVHYNWANINVRRPS